MRRISTLQSLRFFAFLSIFCLHMQIKFFFNAAWGVSFFIILSGFLYGYKYCNTDYKFTNIKDFTITRIKKFYPLHIIMLIATIPLSEIFVDISRNDYLGMMSWLKKLIINIILLQDYFSKDYYSFNGVSWFLSLVVFLTIFTIPLMAIIIQIGKSYNGITKLIFVMIGIVALDYIYVLYMKNNSLDIIKYWLYIFPPSRIPEYLCGLIVGYIIRKREDTINIKNYTILEISSIAMLLIVLQFLDVDVALSRGIIWIIPNIFLISIFSLEKGKISKIFSNKLFVFMGNISFEMFIIHQVIIRYCTTVVQINSSELIKLYVAIYAFILTVIISNFVNSSIKNNNTAKQLEKFTAQSQETYN